MLRFVMHYGIHFIIPILVAYIFYKPLFKTACIILLLGIIIDIDHLWATPIFSSTRCSINFHFLHSYYAIALYAMLFVIKKTRLIGLALLIHIAADTVDCLLM